VVSTQSACVSIAGVASFGEALNLVATLYTSKKGGKDFSEKAYRVSLVGLAAGKRKEIAFAELDLGAFASANTTPRRADHLLNLTHSKKVSNAAAYLTITSNQLAQVCRPGLGNG